MMPAFQDLMGKEVIDQAIGTGRRYSTPEEQAWPLVCLGSPRLSYVGRRGAGDRRRLERRHDHGPPPGAVGRLTQREWPRPADWEGPALR